MDNGIDLNKIPSPDVFVTFSKEEQEAIMGLDSMRDVKKGDMLIKEGQYFKQSFFIVKGVVRQYRIIDGVEKTSNFYLEDEAIHSITRTLDSTKSSFNLECLEDGKVSVVSFDKEREICGRFPRFTEMCRVTTEKYLQEFQEHMALYMASNPQERYKNILSNKPQLIERVPQYHLASYLGIKPESLSRIRKRLAEEK